MSSGRYESSENGSAGTAIVFLLIGLGLGTLAALALAPKTGKKFRRDLRRGYQDAKETVQDWSEEAQDRARDAKERVRGAVQRGASFADDLRQRSEPLRRAINRF
jgi:gas vesicle protein